MVENLDETVELNQICRTPEQLRRWVKTFLKLNVPMQAVCPKHNSPLEYLWSAYHEPAEDLVVWAPRGGGKTRLAAVATLLDLLHKPGCGVRVLGGSLDQSLRLWEHLLPDLEDHLDENEKSQLRRASRKVRLASGSSAAALPQSERAVRGLRVQKLRCDEVEMFDPHIWEAAQLVTRSITDANGSSIRGSIEAISTFHRPGGLMQRIIDRAEEHGSPRVLKWCLLDVLERCPEERKCETCPLLDDCGRVAKTRCDGFFSIDDAIRLKHRVSLDTWQSEMLCRRPVVSDCVFPNFDSEIHVRSYIGSPQVGQICLAMDFGFHNPFACLWIVDDGVACHVIDEYVQPMRTIGDHVDQIRTRSHGTVKHICCDPAGAARNDHTAESNIGYLRKEGYRVHSCKSSIIDGLELIRCGLRPAAGQPTLFISPNCKQLISAFKSLKYPKGGGELPLKDGTHDHPIDALRYFYVNRTKLIIEPPRRY
ncbi:MAG TPA: hypothetical protein VH518_11730 [Tepidisphaeraceae bacterium]